MRHGINDTLQHHMLPFQTIQLILCKASFFKGELFCETNTYSRQETRVPCGQIMLT